jgi:hypothetical protein
VARRAKRTHVKTLVNLRNAAVPAVCSSAPTAGTAAFLTKGFDCARMKMKVFIVVNRMYN